MALPIGPLEVGLIILIILIIFGPSKLPQLARAIGESIKEFKKASKEGEEVKKEVSEEEIKEIAKKLGISTEGRSKEELIEEVKRRLSEGK